MVRALASPCTDVATQGTGWLVSSFQYSDVVTGGSESSLSDVISIAFTVTSVATGQPTSCSATVTLDQGVKWDPRIKYDCQLQAGLSTQFAFDNASNKLSIYQTWTCPDAAKS
ncbi:hypothetical protein GQ53DRAFT_748907 [Thozetella sp. PMI_491]|nr:hypothetical protein GQ53DRAFT_748907 [Thozetella sp. PMI_491]